MLIPCSGRTADIDATAVHYLFDFVQTNRERRRVDPATNLEGPGPITVILANPSKQVVRQMEHANLVSYIRAFLPILFVSFPDYTVSLQAPLRWDMISATASVVV